MMKITTMQNEFGRIGAFIFDLVRGGEMEHDAEGSRFLDDEFYRITMSLGYQWKEEMPGYQYLLEFHKMEAARLMEAVVKLENIQPKPLHKELILQLVSLINRIDKMRGSSGISATPFNLN